MNQISAVVLYVQKPYFSNHKEEAWGPPDQHLKEEGNKCHLIEASFHRSTVGMQRYSASARHQGRNYISYLKH